MYRMVVLLSVTALGLGLLGCGAEAPLEPESPPPRPRQTLSIPSPETLFSKIGEEPYEYDGTGRRDPFKPLIADKKPTVALDEGTMHCPPLQEFELASLKVVAIVWGELGRKAMVKAPNGRGYSINEEMLVGRSCSRVLRIESNAVIIEELRRDADGNASREEVILKLREQEG